MKHRTSKRFRRELASLPSDVQRAADKAFEIMKEDPWRRSLQFKELRPGIWSARVGLGYRVLAEREGDEFTWVWIGPHAEYDVWFGGE